MAYYSPETVDETRVDDGAKPGQRIYLAMHSSVRVQSLGCAEFRFVCPRETCRGKTKRCIHIHSPPEKTPSKGFQKSASLVIDGSLKLAPPTTRPENRPWIRRRGTRTRWSTCTSYFAHELALACHGYNVEHCERLMLNLLVPCLSQQVMTSSFDVFIPEQCQELVQTLLRGRCKVGYSDTCLCPSVRRQVLVRDGFSACLLCPRSGSFAQGPPIAGFCTSEPHMMANSIAGCRIKLMDPIGGKPGVLAEVLPFELSTAES
ncbi:hypothetical protein CFAM422_007137 [Trichoderma lentiforme]|uniref:Uncharacterized protein n=1 Tax=Trichoderma lentiforme TaxID=1567552 RepID=A0A9P4XDX1_9HYPO|nr:hypothetical protein CFAM422_007137 [Trichoderma lentiforme]